MDRLEADEKKKKDAEEKVQKEAAQEQAKKEAEEAAKQKAVADAAAAVAQKEAAETEAKAQIEKKSKQDQADAAAKKEAAAPAARPKSLTSLADRLKSRPTTEPPTPPAAPDVSAPTPTSTPAPTPASGLRPGGAPSPGLRPGGGGPSPTAGAGLRPGGGLSRSAPTPPSSSAGLAKVGSGKRHVYTKQEILSFRELDCCLCRPQNLPERVISRMAAQGGGGGGGGGGGDRRRGGNNRQGGGGSDWSRGSAPPTRARPQPGNQPPQQQQQQGGSQWSRGAAPPKPPPNKGGNGGRGGQNNQQPLYDGPVAPLTKGENRWMPKKNATPMIAMEKKVQSILNKMTKEKFEKLSGQICDIPVLSYEMLSLVIHIVYEKAINEPYFGDMYANLCKKIAQNAQVNSFVQIIESDEDYQAGGEESGHKVYRWSNDVGLTDEQVVGPFNSPEECIATAMDPANAPEPVERSEQMELVLDSLKIQKGQFMKIMKHPDPEEGEAAYYTVYFAVSEAKECGQQLSEDIFLSERECASDANKQNSFKRSLLNKCEDEFNKQDMHVAWKKEKKEYDETKSKLTETQRETQKIELEIRRVQLKKQMLGNVKFIGQLFKVGLLKEKIMRYCVAQLLKLDESKGKSKNPEYRDTGDMDLDEEDHEAVCSMFGTIGKTIDHNQAATFMQVCFDKIEKLSNNTKIPTRPRFMYKDLIELRANYWKLRRQIETAKTIEEIRKDVEREERQQVQQAQQMGGGYRGGGGGGRGGDRSRDDFRNNRGRNDNDYRGNDNRRGGGGVGGGSNNQGGGSNRPRAPKPSQDKDGFTKIAARGGSGKPQQPAPKARPAAKPQQKEQPVEREEASPPPTSEPASTAAPLSKDKLELRVNNIRTEFMQDRKNVDELLLSVDELSGTPEAGLTMVQLNADRLMDCKEDERKAIVEMITIIFQKGKLTKGDVENGMADMVEFIESFVIDAPKAFDFLGEMLGSLLNAKALNITWLCEQCKKISPGAAEKVVKCSMEYIKVSHGADAVKSSVGGEGPALGNVIGADKWKAISDSFLA